MIGFFEVRQEEREQFSDEFGSGHYYSEDPIQGAPPEVLKKLEIASIFVDSEIEKSTISSLRNCKHITTRSTGFDHINVEAAHSEGISVSHVPSYGPETIAEFTFALLLNWTRNVSDAYHRVKSHNNYTWSGLRGMDLKGKSIGIVGTGDIGSQVVKIADGFGMDIHAYDVTRKDQLVTQHEVQYHDTLNEMLPELDVLTLHIPHNEETHHLIDKSTIERLPTDALLINTARGELVDSSSLATALKAGNLAGAGLDVMAKEGRLKNSTNQRPDPSGEGSATLLADRELIDLENVIITPHIAFYTKESEQQIISTTIDNIRTFQNNDQAVHEI